MNGLTRKTLLLRSLSGTKPEKLSRSFAVLKCETRGNGTVLELPGIANGDKSSLRLFVYNGREALSVALPDEQYPLNKPYSTENGLCAAVIEPTENNVEVLLFGNTLKEKITINEVRKIYEKNCQKNDVELENAEKSVLFQKKERAAGSSENQNRKLTQTSADAIAEAEENDDEGEYARDYTEIIPLDVEKSAEGLFTSRGDDVCGKNHDEGYDDEAVADVNYFEIEKSKSVGDASRRTQETTARESSSFAPIKENYDEISDTTSHDRKNEQAEREQAEKGKQADEHEEDLRACPFQRRQPAFYDEKRGEIEQLFDKYPPISSLSGYIPESRWVRIEYKKDGHYIVGTIKKDDVMQYIVYGVPGTRGLRPHGFDRYSVFLPESLFSVSGKGYWCTFQNAETGKIESPE